MSGTENSIPARKRPGRRLWWSFWILIGVLGGVANYYGEPRIYRSATNVLIIPQRVPERFVEPTVTADLNERLNLITQQILSRTRLERIIQEFNLYEEERKLLIMEDVIERMRDDININVARPREEEGQVASFSVSFDGTVPRTTMRVTERLASLFVQENLEDRELLADQTDQFLKGQLEETRRRLLDQELRLRAGRQDVTYNLLTVEHGVLIEFYKQILLHSEAAKMALHVEQRQIGEQFKIIDGARLPERPISPRPFPYLALGALSGLGAGIVASILLFVWRRGRPRATVTA